MTKVCRDCRAVFPATSEHFATLRGYLVSYCRACSSTRSKAYHAKTPESRIAAGLKFKFGLSLERWNEMFAEQSGCCKICGAHQSTLKKRLAVDHCHTTLKIRGLLCQHCNQMLGHARDKVSTLLSAAEYLTRG